MSEPEKRPLIQMQNVNKFFGKFQALKNINLEVKRRTYRSVWPIRIGEINDDPLY